MNLEIKHAGMVMGSFLTAQMIDGISDLWQREAVWILFLVAGIIITFIKDAIDPTKKVTGIKMIWSIVVVVVLCFLLRFYRIENEGMSSFWFYFWTVMIGIFSPSAVFKVLQNSDDKAESAFAKIVNAFVDGLVFKINTIFGNNRSNDNNNNENGE